MNLPDVSRRGHAPEGLLRIPAAILAGLLVLGCGRAQDSIPAPPPVGPTPTQTRLTASDLASRAEAAAWLQKNAIAFDTSKPGSGLADLEPLKAIIGDARIVALGEATHGTHEFFEMKHRLLEFLVTEMGFTDFAIEASWPEANLINDYVRTGRGDPHKLLHGMYFWTWDTEEVLDLILWMRSYNQDRGDAPEMGFHGIDIQMPALAIQNVLDYLSKVDLRARAEAWEGISCFATPLSGQRGLYLAAYKTTPAEEKRECRKALAQVHADLEANRDKYEARSSAAEFAFALQSMRVVQQAQELYAEDIPGQASFHRDRAMADNVSWLLEHGAPGRKVVVWAHNFHVRVAGGSMGSYLRQQYRKALVVVGFDFYQGSFNAVDTNLQGKRTGRGVIEHSAPKPPPGSYEALFHEAGLPRFIVDLRSASDQAQSWLVVGQSMRNIGASYSIAADSRLWMPAKPAYEYDVMVHFEETTPSHLFRYSFWYARPGSR